MTSSAYTVQKIRAKLSLILPPGRLAYGKFLDKRGRHDIDPPQTRSAAAFIITCGALVLIAGISSGPRPALAQTAQVLAQGQTEQPDQPRIPRAGDPTTTPAPAPPLSPELKALRSKLDAFKLDLDQKEAALSGRELH